MLERDKVRQLQEGYNRKDNEAWHQQGTIDTLKLELRGIASLAAQLQEHIIESGSARPPVAAMGRAEVGGPALTAGPSEPAEPRSAASEEAQMALKLALLDLEDRLQQAVSLVLDELNTRKAAEGRIRELEDQLAAVRRRIGGGRQ